MVIFRFVWSCDECLRLAVSDPSTSGGVKEHEDKRTITAPPLMWVKARPQSLSSPVKDGPLLLPQALDLLLSRMQEDGFPFRRVAALSGVGQQHGSVYWRTGAEGVLRVSDMTGVWPHSWR